MYSQSLASPIPRCCVSLSAFYNQTIVSCPRCSCGCQGQPGTKCVKYISPTFFNIFFIMCRACLVTHFKKILVSWICRSTDHYLFRRELSSVKTGRYGETPPLLKQNQDPTPVVRCSEHMCPIRVHWHLKESYKQYWRAKMTVTNFHIMKNYSEWNLVVLHPNLQSLTQVFSFNYAPLNRYGYISKLLHKASFYHIIIV
jgi:hypothetical protein